MGHAFVLPLPVHTLAAEAMQGGYMVCTPSQQRLCTHTSASWCPNSRAGVASLSRRTSDQEWLGCMAHHRVSMVHHRVSMQQHHMSMDSHALTAVPSRWLLYPCLTWICCCAQPVAAVPLRKRDPPRGVWKSPGVLHTAQGVVNTPPTSTHCPRSCEHAPHQGL